jgi:hypothetical protein
MTAETTPPQKGDPYDQKTRPTPMDKPAGRSSDDPGRRAPVPFSRFGHVGERSAGLDPAIGYGSGFSLCD